MQRWNGWGDDSRDYPVTEQAVAFLTELIGAGAPPQDADLQTVINRMPPSRLPPHPLVGDDAETRLRHATGQSFPDWVAMRYGRFPAFPDGVAYPMSDRDIQTLIGYAQDVGAKLIPYGGGTSVVGHINPIAGDAPVLTVNMQRMNRLLKFDETSHLATFGAGVVGPDLEAQLRARGFMLGHFPQSFELSTLGGWVVTRSSGQQSRRYGRIEDLFAGGKLISPAGTLVMPPHPASAAGPDIRQMILGSEGRMGIVTETTVRVSPLPQRENFHAVFFPDFERGTAAVRRMVQADLPLSMMRLSTAVETVSTLALAGHERVIGTLERLLARRGLGDDKCLLMLGFTGDSGIVKAARKAALEIAGDNKGVHVGQQFGKQWQKGRFHTPYLRNTLWDVGYAIDTLETATTWDRIPALLRDIEAAIRPALEGYGEKVHVFTHLSHMYASGASIYTTYLFRLADTPEEMLERWGLMKTAASQAIVANQGTISHQHGVGFDHAPYLPAEKGAMGIKAIDALCKTFDPDGMMNPGKLIEA